MGKEYDLVFVTWEKLKAHKRHDQYLVYISKETKMIEHVSFTVRDNYLKTPGSAMMFATMTFSDFRNVDGLLMPFKQTNFFLVLKRKRNFFIRW